MCNLEEISSINLHSLHNSFLSGRMLLPTRKSLEKLLYCSEYGVHFSRKLLIEVIYYFIHYLFIIRNTHILERVYELK